MLADREDELPASASRRPLKTYVCSPPAANVLEAPAASRTRAARTTYVKRLLISNPPGWEKRGKTVRSPPSRVSRGFGAGKPGVKRLRQRGEHVGCVRVRFYAAHHLCDVAV